MLLSIVSFLGVVVGCFFLGGLLLGYCAPKAKPENGHTSQMDKVDKLTYLNVTGWRRRLLFEY
jgi:hypothetical protein